MLLNCIILPLFLLPIPTEHPARVPQAIMQRKKTGTTLSENVKMKLPWSWPNLTTRQQVSLLTPLQCSKSMMIRQLIQYMWAGAPVRRTFEKKKRYDD
jgi:hypothetical protein